MLVSPGPATSSVVGFPSIPTPVMPLKAYMWSNERFSSISTNTRSTLRRARLRPPNRLASAWAIASRAQRSQSHASQTSVRPQENTMQIALTIQANALQTHFATQYHALHTHLATQYQALQNHSATQFHGVYQRHFLLHSPHSLEPSSAHSEHWLEPSSAHCVHS